MKNKILYTLLMTLLVAILSCRSASPVAATPKKLLVVTTTTGFRHGSIPTLEKVLTQLGASSGEFTVDFVRQPPNKPADLKRDATDDERAAHETAEAAWNDALKLALQKLSPDLRETVILRDLEELEYREIAQVLNVPEGTVKSRLNRGRADLGRILRHYKGLL